MIERLHEAGEGFGKGFHAGSEVGIGDGGIERGDSEFFERGAGGGEPGDGDAWQLGAGGGLEFFEFSKAVHGDGQSRRRAMMYSRASSGSLARMRRSSGEVSAGDAPGDAPGDGMTGGMASGGITDGVPPKTGSQVPCHALCRHFTDIPPRQWHLASSGPAEIAAPSSSCPARNVAQVAFP